MALIAVFVTAAAIAGVALLSYPPGDAAPAMIARSVTDESGSTYIYHDGGDPLEWGHFAILVDGGEWTENFSLVDASGIEYEPGTWTTWETGEVLVYNKTPLGKGTPRIQIVGEGVGRTGSDWLLHELGNGTPTETTPTPTETTPTPTETTPTPTETTPTPVSLVANFTANITAGPAPLSVQFTDTSTGEPTSWSWDFGDGGTSTERNPVYTYTAAGTYTVTLVAKNAGTSDTKTKTGYITAYGWPSPGLLGTYYPTMDWTGEGVTRIDRRIWFADNAANTAHYLNAGTDEYNWPIATLGKDDQFSVIYEGYLVVPSDDTYTFYLTSDDGSWLWIDDMETALIDNGGYHSTQTMTAEIPLAAGSHKVMAKMFEGNGLAVFHLEWSSPAFARTPVDAFCRSPPPASADFTATPQNGTAPLSVQFTDASTGGPTSWSWNFGDGATSAEQSPVHIYASPSIYTVSLTATNAAGSDTETKMGYITVATAPTVTAISPDSMNRGNTVWPTITGTGFMSGATVKLTKAGESDIIATNIVVNSPTSINCKIELPLQGKHKGSWNVVVTNSDGQFGTLVDGFEVTNK